MQTAAAAEPKTELELLREEVAFLKSCGIIELAIRNPNVASYMEHWEGRAEKAEQELLVAWVDPEQLGWKLMGFKNDGRNVWKTDKGEFYLFPPGQKEQLLVPRA
jgi:hypothetical protein